MRLIIWADCGHRPSLPTVSREKTLKITYEQIDWTFYKQSRAYKFIHFLNIGMYTDVQLTPTRCKADKLVAHFNHLRLRLHLHRYWKRNSSHSFPAEVFDKTGVWVGVSVLSYKSYLGDNVVEGEGKELV